MVNYILDNTFLFISFLAVSLVILSTIILILLAFNFNIKIKKFVNDYYIFYLILSLLFFVLIVGIIVVNYKYKGGIL